jgi:hypothetical protein
MAAVAYVDTAPEVKAHDGHFLMSFQSGDQTMPLLLTRHALLMLVRLSNAAHLEAIEEEQGFIPTPFTLSERRGNV